MVFTYHARMKPILSAVRRFGCLRQPLVLSSVREPVARATSSYLYFEGRLGGKNLSASNYISYLSNMQHNPQARYLNGATPTNEARQDSRLSGPMGLEKLITSPKVRQQLLDANEGDKELLRRALRSSHLFLVSDRMQESLGE